MNVRVCEVEIYPTIQKGIFHRFVDLATPKDGEFIRQTLCLVELKNGSLVQVTPKKIKFLDTKEVFAKEWKEIEDERTITTRELSQDA